MPVQTWGWFVGGGPLLVRCAEAFRGAGHEIGGVVTDDATTRAWAAGHGIAAIPLTADLPAVLRATPCDYLFSVGNHTLLAAEVIGAARRAAINFHYGPLPTFAGVHAPVWAILEGQTRYGVTWHEMTAGVDAGRIVARLDFEVPADETAAGLNARCFDAGVESFQTVLGELSTGTHAWRAQDSTGRRVFRRHQRPEHFCLIDWTRPAVEIDRLVRALNFGRLENTFGAARVWLPGGALVVTELGVPRAAARAAAAGTIVAVESDQILVAAGDGIVALRGLTRVTGEPLTIADAAAEFRLETGVELPRLAASEFSPLVRHFQSATRHEDDWLHALAGIAPVTIDGAAVPAGGESRDRVRVPIDVAPEMLRTLAGDSGADAATVLLALAAMQVTRASGRPLTLALHTDGLASMALASRGLLSSVVPVSTDLARSWGDHLRTIVGRCREAEERGTFFVDLCARYPRWPALGAYAAWRRSVVLHMGDATGAPSSADLVCVATPGTSRLTFDASSESWSLEAVTQMARELEAAVDDLASAPDAPLASVSRLDLATRETLLVEWNRTECAVPAACIHELFEAQVRLTPDASAVVFRDRAISYRELNRHANRVAADLRRHGIGPDTIVGVFVDRSVDMVAALLGILKAGGAYLPLDPGFPKERLSWMLEDTAAPVVVTRPHLRGTLPRFGGHVVTVDCSIPLADLAEDLPNVATPDNLAYVIFTSGSTGRPKGVMIEHRQVVNLFAGMDEHLGGRHAGTWLSVTSISFDISVLELFWTLARGFTVVVQDEVVPTVGAVARDHAAAGRGMDFGLFYFSADVNADGNNRYRLLLEGAKYADAHGFKAVWTPERHFHEFGGLYPNPAVTSAAIASVTSRVRLRAGSVVLPLHNPIRVAEEWAVVDHLSGGRVELSFASGWHANDFALMPQNYRDRRDVMLSGIDTIRRLWSGEPVTATNGHGETIEVKSYPPPLQPRPPFWIAAAGNVETFRLAGRIGANLLTNLLGQNAADLATKIAAYRQAWREANHPGDGVVALMLHTFVGPDLEQVRATVRQPLINYLKTSTELVKQTRWEFPAFANPTGRSLAGQDVELSADDVDAMMAHAFDRYFETSGLFGTPHMCLERVRELQALGVDEVACLVDFGIATDTVLAHLPYLNEVREQSQPRSSSEDFSIAAQLVRHRVTHFQATPSLMRAVVADEAGRHALSQVSTLLVGGEPLPPALAHDLLSVTKGQLLNVYGPTETTVWSTVARVIDSSDVTIGRPIANTRCYVVDAGGAPQPVGTAGELLIGGLGVARGYWNRPELTAERFLPNPFLPGSGDRVYRTGDLARYRPDGRLECLGRLDHQVKISGHRIELGEVAAALETHPAVAQAVVAVKSGASGEPRLVGYVVPRASASLQDASQVTRWQAIWDETYGGFGTTRPTADATFDLAGWKDSYTGDAVSETDMRDWVEATVARVLSLRPRRILEVGCGTGLLLHRLAPHVDHYAAIDFSPQVIGRVRESVLAQGLTNVTLRVAPADVLADESDLGPVDLVIINSVIQYFPDADYLGRVLTHAVARVSPGGAVFVGDVRNLTLLEAFHASVELEQAPAGMPVDEYRQRVRDRMQYEPELVVEPGAFYDLAATLPKVTAVEIHLKRGRARNEMTRFRYDVIWRVGGDVPREPVAQVDGAGFSLAEIRSVLASATGAVRISGLLNSRVARDVALLARPALGAGPATVAELNAAASAPIAGGLDPDDVIAAAPGWYAEAGTAESGASDRFDVTFSPAGAPRARGARPSTVGRDWREGVRQPQLDRGVLTQALKRHVQARLPGPMVPGVFVVLDALPLTPNGKIDRNALPEPERQRAVASSSYVAPGNNFERAIAETWQELLALERVGIRDNVFDMGANSLLMVQAHVSLREKLGQPLSLVDLFRYPTVQSLAAFLAQSGPAAPAQTEVLTASEARGRARIDSVARRRQERQQARPAPLGGGRAS